MRRALLALIFASVAPVATATTASSAPAGAALAAAKAVDVAGAVTRVDYGRRYYHRGHRPHYRRPVDYGYYAPRRYYPAPVYSYAAPPVVYYQPPPVVYYPPPVVYAPVAPYRYGAPSAAYYDGYSDW
jgi:hypothetical protein